MARRYHADDPAEAEALIRDRFERQARISFRVAARRRPRATSTERAARMTTRFGLQLWSQSTTWPAFRDAALAAEAAGWDSVWTWDHLLAIFGPWEQPIFEGWTALAGSGPADPARPPRADGRGQHDPRARADRQAGHDPRPPVGRTGGARHRRRLVRARARGLRHRLRGEPGRAAGLPRRVGHAPAPAARRRAVRPRRAASNASTTRCARRGRSRPTCRSSSAAPVGGRPCAPWPSGRMPGTRPARWTRSSDALGALRGHADAVGRDLADARDDGQLPDRHRRRRGGRPGAAGRRCWPPTA